MVGKIILVCFATFENLSVQVYLNLPQLSISIPVLENLKTQSLYWEKGKGTVGISLHNQGWLITLDLPAPAS